MHISAIYIYYIITLWADLKKTGTLNKSKGIKYIENILNNSKSNGAKLCRAPGKFSSGSISWRHFFLLSSTLFFSLVFCFWWLDVYKGKFKKKNKKDLRIHQLHDPDFTCLEGCIGSVRRRKNKQEEKRKEKDGCQGWGRKTKWESPQKQQ